MSKEHEETVCIDCGDEDISVNGRCRECSLDYMASLMRCEECGRLGHVNELGRFLFGLGHERSCSQWKPLTDEECASLRGIPSTDQSEVEAFIAEEGPSDA